MGNGSDNTEEHIVECEHCGGPRNIHESIKAYCSSRCHFRAKGEGILNSIEDDHTVCATCFRRVKETSRASDDFLWKSGVDKLAREAYIGEESLTPDAVPGSMAKGAISEVGSPASNKKIVGTVGCKCGAYDLRTRDGVLERIEGATTLAENLYRELERRYDAGDLDREPSRSRLFEALDEFQGDWEYAVGYALYSK